MKFVSIALLGGMRVATGAASPLGAGLAGPAMPGFQQQWDLARLADADGERELVLELRVSCKPGCAVDARLQMRPRALR